MNINLLIQEYPSLNPDWFNSIKPLSEKIQKRCYNSNCLKLFTQKDSNNIIRTFFRLCLPFLFRAVTLFTFSVLKVTLQMLYKN